MGYDVGKGISSAAPGAAAGAVAGPWGAGIGGTIGLLGGITTNNKSNGIRQGAISAALNNYYEERRMRNAHQWETEDLIKSGHNPALTAKGSTASSIAGNAGGSGGLIAQAMNNATNSNIAANNRSIQSALGTAQIFNKMEEIANTKRLQRAQTNKTDAETMATNLNNQLVEKYGNKKEKQNLANMVLEAEATKAKTAKDRANTEAIKQDIAIQAPQQVQEEMYANFLRKHPKVAAAIKIGGMTVDGASTIAGLAGSILGGKAALSAAKNMTAPETIHYYNKRGELKGTRTRERK